MIVAGVGDIRRLSSLKALLFLLRRDLLGIGLWRVLFGRQSGFVFDARIRAWWCGCVWCGCAWWCGCVWCEAKRSDLDGERVELQVALEESQDLSVSVLVVCKDDDFVGIF